KLWSNTGIRATQLHGIGRSTKKDMRWAGIGNRWVAPYNHISAKGVRTIISGVGMGHAVFPLTAGPDEISKNINDIASIGRPLLLVGIRRDRKTGYEKSILTKFGVRRCNG